MADLVSEQGIWASGADLPEHVSGLFLREESLGMAILVNYHNARVRKRFSYAHEYCHALVDRDHHLTISDHANREQLIEVRANSFAATFLMPREGVIEFLAGFDKVAPSRESLDVFDDATEAGEEEVMVATGRRIASNHRVSFHDVAALSLHFGTSYLSAAYRLKSLGITTAEQTNELISVESAGKAYRLLLAQSFGIEDEEAALRRPRRGDRELTAQILHRAFEAYRRELISEGRVAEFAEKLGVKWDTVEPMVRRLQG
jgi:hypothetical protein